MITSNLIPAINFSKSRTSERLQNRLQLKSKPLHRVSRVYPDGTTFTSDVRHEEVFNFLAHELIYRSEPSIIVDGIMIHVADSLDETKAIEIAKNIESKGLCFNIPAPRYTISIH